MFNFELGPLKDDILYTKKFFFFAVSVHGVFFFVPNEYFTGIQVFPKCQHCVFFFLLKRITHTIQVHNTAVVGLKNPESFKRYCCRYVLCDKSGNELFKISGVYVKFIHFILFIVFVGNAQQDLATAFARFSPMYNVRRVTS